MMTEQEKQAVETLTRSFTRMETLYKVKCMEVEAREEEISRLKTENAALRERLEKAKQKVEETKRDIEPTMYTSFCGFVVRWCTLMEHKELYGTQEAAEARLKEIKEK